jgi:queuine/archaeosine tRNA-ribosyltransferase
MLLPVHVIPAAGLGRFGAVVDVRADRVGKIFGLSGAAHVAHQRLQVAHESVLPSSLAHLCKYATAKLRHLIRIALEAKVFGTKCTDELRSSVKPVPYQQL